MTPRVDAFALLVGLTETTAERQPNPVKRGRDGMALKEHRAGRDKVARSPSLRADIEVGQVWFPKHAHWSWRGSSSPSPAKGMTTRRTPCHTRPLSLAGVNADGLHIEVSEEV